MEGHNNRFPGDGRVVDAAHGGLAHAFYQGVNPVPVFQGQINEANQRAFYQRWLDLMKADSWKTVPQRDVPKMKEGV